MNAPIAKKILSPVSLEFKFSSEAPGQFTGYASVFGVRDDCGDIVMPGAFKGTLAKRPARNIKMARDHDLGCLVGVWDSIVEDQKGLAVSGHLLVSELEDAAETYALMKAGQLDSLSIGYRSIDWEYDAVTDTRQLKAVNLFEISIVPFGMLDVAKIDAVKSADLDAINSLSEAERFLREVALFDRKSATAFVSRIKRLSQREAAGEAKEAALLERLARLNSR